MDIQSFLESGILESYVLDQCSPEERQQVEQMARDHAIVRTELEAIELAMSHYAQAHSIQAPEGLREKILQAATRPQAPGHAGHASDGADQPASSNAGRIINILFAVISLAMGAYVLRAQQQSKVFEAQIADLKTQLQVCNDRSDKNRQIAAFVRDRDTRSILLTDGQNLKITVFSNELRQETYLDMSGIFTPSKGLYFQFWAIVDGMPVSLGMIDLQAPGGLQPFKYVANAQAYAISQENTPEGSKMPTIVVAQGKTS
jgi:anti-sigma-K factor RskA